MKLIIAEKPSVARSIAEAVGANQSRDGFFEGGGYFVTFAFGHLFRLFEASDYDPRFASWSLDNLPVIPSPFKYQINDDAGVKKQFATMKRLAADPGVTTIINACDSDREGSLIFAEIFQALETKKQAQRLWVSSHTPEDLNEGFKNIRSGVQDAPLTAAGYARQWTDWLLGINFTRATTKKISADGKILNVGRVILPTLGLIYKREQEIKNFKPIKYYVLTATFAAAPGTYNGVFFQDESKDKFDSPDFLETIRKAVISQPGTIISCKTTRETEGPGKLFNLTDLQGHITSKFKGWTADKVLKIAQELYESKYITYPRTSSRYLDDSQKEPTKKVLEALKNLPAGILPPQMPVVWHDRKSVFDSSKVDSHPALMPTYILPNFARPTPDQNTVYIEILKRFVAQFSPLAEYEKTEAITLVKTFKFWTRARILITPGWMLLYQKDDVVEEDPKDDDAAQATLDFPLREKLSVTTKDAKTEGKETKPPQRYTVKTLLAAMQNCGREVEDESQILKGYAIGTAATRADCLKKLEKVEYVTMKGKSFFITTLGNGLIESFPIREMIEPDFTGRLEKQLKEVEQGTLPQETVMTAARQITTDGIGRIKGTTVQIQREIKSLGKCPLCGRDVVETPKAFSCTGYRDGSNPCKFALWKEDHWLGLFGKHMTATAAKGFLAGRAVTIKGMKSKAGKVFDGKIKMELDSEKRIHFTFDK